MEVSSQAVRWKETNVREKQVPETISCAEIIRAI